MIASTVAVDRIVVVLRIVRGILSLRVRIIYRCTQHTYTTCIINVNGFDFIVLLFTVGEEIQINPVLLFNVSSRHVGHLYEV